MCGAERESIRSFITVHPRKIKNAFIMEEKLCYPISALTVLAVFCGIYKFSRNPAFLKTLPLQFGCEYAGTLIKGDMFSAGLVDEKIREKMLAPFTEMGRVFSRSGQFEKSAVDAFAVPEYMSKSQIRTFNLFGKHLSCFFMPRIAKKLGCKEKLDARPFAE